MQKIRRTGHCGDGVNVVWEKDGKETASFFSFTRLRNRVPTVRAK